MRFLERAQNYLWHHLYYQRGRWLRELSVFLEPYSSSLIRSPRAVGTQLTGLLCSSRPKFATRLGAVEAQCLTHYLFRRPRSPYPHYIRRKIHANAGVFHDGDHDLDSFSHIYLESIRWADLFGVCPANNPWERSVLNHCFKTAKIRVLNHSAAFEYAFHNDAVLVPLMELEPYRHDPPWTETLRGRRVLVIHPFSDSIVKNYTRNRMRLFRDPRVLPEFELLTITAVQSVAGNRPEFATWKEALEHMKILISRVEFDVALLGCGAYGLPLGAFIKAELGRTAVHLGGCLQLLFGITGKRWRENAWYVQNLFNEHWGPPLPNECPEGFSHVEKGCYW